MGDPAPLAHLIGALTGVAGALLPGKGPKGLSGFFKNSAPTPEMG